MTALTSALSDSIGIVGSCINCTEPANLIATFALILIGMGLAIHFDRRKPVSVKIRPRQERSS